jgi:hypothetical protein
VGFEQSARAIGRRNPQFEIPPVQADKFANSVFDFLFAGPAGPTSVQVRLDSPGISRGKLAIGGPKQLLIGEMGFLRQHSGLTIAFYRNIPFDAVLFSLFVLTPYFSDFLPACILTQKRTHANFPGLYFEQQCAAMGTIGSRLADVQPRSGWHSLFAAGST